MLNELNALGEGALSEIESTPNVDSLEALRLSLLGKKGSLSELLRGLSRVPVAERPTIGGAANQWKAKIETALQVRRTILEQALLERRLKAERLDFTLPARLAHRGVPHVITQVTRRLVEILSRLGFEVTLGPEVETEYFNFEAVNIPSDHPARDMQDTFFISPGVVLRTHTSSVQMRALRSQTWPLRILSPGAVYRCDNDSTHSPMFHQLEGLWVDQGVKMSDLKGTLEFLARELFGKTTQIRFRPSYFPFVEPGAEVDVSCFQCRSIPIAGCSVCRGSGWLEVLGAGMVHPRLFEHAGYAEHDRNLLSGFAFGIGIERVAMLLYGIPDLRMLFKGDMRFLSQF